MPDTGYPTLSLNVGDAERFISSADHTLTVDRLCDSIPICHPRACGGFKGAFQSTVDPAAASALSHEAKFALPLAAGVGPY